MAKVIGPMASADGAGRPAGAPPAVQPVRYMSPAVRTAIPGIARLMLGLRPGAPRSCSIRRCMLCTPVRHMSTASHNESDMFRGSCAERVTGHRETRSPAVLPPVAALIHDTGPYPQVRRGDNLRVGPGAHGGDGTCGSP